MKTLPKYWVVEDPSSNIIDILSEKTGEEWDNNETGFIGFDGEINFLDDLEEFDEDMVVVKNEDFLKLFKESPGEKNLILKKDLPSIFLDGIEYARPKGTVYVKTRNSWALISGGGGRDKNDIDEADFEKNKDWYGLTIKEPTYEILRIGRDNITFEEGLIKVGCQTVSNELVRKIASKLQD